MFTLATVTCQSYPELTQDDRLLLESLARADVQLWNPAAMMRSNTDKRYLQKLESGGAAETWVSGPQTKPGEQADLDKILGRCGAMLQALLPEVESAGEWSLMFFGGVFSHAIKKRPARGDFRVQTEHGGSVQLQEAPAALIEEAEDILRGLRQDLLYARVDGIEIDGEFVLLELELVEPELFFRCDPAAPQRLVEALLELAERGAPA